ncbi:MAG: AI-2E family transporter [Syntrophobacteraceae bacterium]
MKGQVEEKRANGAHTLDEESCCIRCDSGLEAEWERQGNTLVERHPYLVGYAFLLSMGVLVFYTHLMIFAMTFLFLYFISDFLTNTVRRYVPFVPKAILFSIQYIVVSVILTVLSYKALPSMAKQFPELANQLQVQLVEVLKQVGKDWDLTPYIEIEELKGSLVQGSSQILRFLMNSLAPLYKGFVQFVFALVINVFLYYEMDRVHEALSRRPGSMMEFLYRFTLIRLRIFYFYFKRVMGGQFIISLINTIISSVVILGLGLPHPVLMIFLVFFCGLFPIVGNLISNSVLTIDAFVSVGLGGAVICLCMLIGVHKLEYLLNSKIIGGIVNLPMSLMLAAIIFSEVLLGIPGLILAIPLALFVRDELEHIPGFPPTSNPPSEGRSSGE